MEEFNIQIFCAGYSEERELKMLIPFANRILVNGEQVWEASAPVAIVGAPEENDGDDDCTEEVSFGEAQKAAREKLNVQGRSSTGEWHPVMLDGSWRWLCLGEWVGLNVASVTAWRIIPSEAQPKRESGGNGAGTSETWEDSEV